MNIYPEIISYVGFTTPQCCIGLLETNSVWALWDFFSHVESEPLLSTPIDDTETLINILNTSIADRQNYRLAGEHYILAPLTK